MRSALGASVLQCSIAMGGLMAAGCTEPDPSESPQPGTATQALTGDLVRKLILPDTIACPGSPPDDGFEHIAISVAAIPGDIAAPGEPSLADRALLATSCRNGAIPEIFLVDPGDPTLPTGPGSPDVTGVLVREIVPTMDGTTPFAPPLGWGSLAFRADVNPPDLLACANPAGPGTVHEVYSINLETEVAQLLFAGAPTTAGLPYCDGMTWDSWNDLVWMSSDISDTVHRYRPPRGGEVGWQEVEAPDGPNTRVFPDNVRRFTINHLIDEGVPCFRDDAMGRTGNSGLQVLGPSELLLACNGQERMFRVRQLDFSLIESFTTDAGRAEDLECDRWTFGFADLPVEQQKSVVWTKDAFDGDLFAVEVPDDTCGRCRPTERMRLSELTETERQNLADLIEEYITANRVAIHHFQISTWHGSSGFFPGHRGYIGGLEFWLYNVVRTSGDPRYSDNFFPLPKWDPGEPFPDLQADPTLVPFLAVDEDACLASEAPPERLDACFPNESDPPQVALPDVFVSEPLGGTMCASYPYDPDDVTASIEALRNTNAGSGSLEGSYHGSSVHCGFPGNQTMCEVYVSPSAVIFWPWHAFIDDIARDYECNCGMECQICTDVFRPFLPNTGASPFFISSGDREPPMHWAAPIGFWFWFDDFVMPPAVRPRATVDHSGFEFQAALQDDAKLIVGIVGQGVELDGRGDFLRVKDREVGEVPSTDFSLDTWVRTTSLEFQGIVDKRNHRGEGYALYLSEGNLGFVFGNRSGKEAHETMDVDLADGEWHHVAAVVNRTSANASGLYIDGQLALGFDATAISGEIVVNEEVWLGRARADSDNKKPRFGPFHRHQLSKRDRHHRFKHRHHRHHIRTRPWHRHGHHPPRHHHGRKDGFFEGQLDEVSLVRHALPRDLVASIFASGSAGKFGSMGNMPTFVEGAPCLVQLGEAIASDADAAFLQPLFDQIDAEVTDGNLDEAAELLDELHDAARDASFNANWDTGGMIFHRIHGVASLCLQVPPFGSDRFTPALE